MRPDEVRLSYSERHPTVYNIPDYEYYANSLGRHRSDLEVLKNKISSFSVPQRSVTDLEREVEKLKRVVDKLRTQLLSLKAV